MTITSSAAWSRISSGKMRWCRLKSLRRGRASRPGRARRHRIRTRPRGRAGARAARARGPRPPRSRHGRDHLRLPLAPAGRPPTAFASRAGTRRMRCARATRSGSAPMFGERSRSPRAIHSQARRSRSRSSLRRARGNWQPPEEAVVLCGASGSGESCCSCCPVLNVLASTGNAERWLAARPEVDAARRDQGLMCFSIQRCGE